MDLAALILVVLSILLYTRLTQFIVMFLLPDLQKWVLDCFAKRSVVQIVTGCVHLSVMVAHGTTHGVCVLLSCSYARSFYKFGSKLCHVDWWHASQLELPAVKV